MFFTCFFSLFFHACFLLYFRLSTARLICFPQCGQTMWTTYFYCIFIHIFMYIYTVFIFPLFCLSTCPLFIHIFIHRFFGGCPPRSNFVEFLINKGIACLRNGSYPQFHNTLLILLLNNLFIFYHLSKKGACRA